MKTFDIIGKLLLKFGGLYKNGRKRRISVLQYGGSYPWYEDKDVVELECIDKYNAVTIELKRIR